MVKARRASPSKAPRRAPAARASTAKDRPPTLISSRTLLEGPSFAVRRDQLQEPGRQRPRTRDVIVHGPSAVILAIDDAGQVVLVRQYRHATGQFLWELPAGGVEPGETPAHCARRELEEETGYRARRWKLLCRYFPAPGNLDEEMFVYLAEGLRPGSSHPEEDEHIEVRLASLAEVEEMLRRGRIRDGKTFSAYAAYRLRG